MAPPWRPPVNLAKPLKNPPARRQPFGPRFWTLLSLAFLCVGRAMAYNVFPALRGDVPYGLKSLGNAWIAVYGVFWLISTILCIVLAFTRRRWVWAGVLAAFPALIWALAYFVTWIQSNDTSWNGAWIYLGVAAVIICVTLLEPIGGWRGRDD